MDPEKRGRTISMAIMAIGAVGTGGILIARQVARKGRVVENITPEELVERVKAMLSDPDKKPVMERVMATCLGLRSFTTDEAVRQSGVPAGVFNPIFRQLKSEGFIHPSPTDQAMHCFDPKIREVINASGILPDIESIQQASHNQ